jgi:trimeric autotransporter adhesin
MPTFPAGSYPAQVVADGASAYWRLGETSGTTANDSIGTAHGTISGGVTLNQTGALADGDKAMAFNGTGTIQTATPFTAPATFTIELWLKSVDENFSNILGNDTGASGTFLLAMGASAKLPYFAFNGATPTAIQDGIAISAAPTWQHLVIVSTPTRTLIYQNGGLRADQSHVKPVAISAPLFVTKNWLGSMDDVAIYPTALTPTQIAAHYQARLVGLYAAGSYPDKVIRDGAAAYWRLGETTGTTAADVIGGNNGTISGGVTLNQVGAISDGDTAMVFNGTTGYISVPSSAAITPTGSFTVEAWVKTLTSTEVPLIEKFDAGNAGYMLSLNNFGGGNYYALWVGNGWVEGPGVVADGQWHHLVGVWNGTTVSLYLDGALRRSIAPTGVNLPATTHALEMARRWDVGTYSNASLDEVAFYPTALSAAQVSAHYAARTWSDASGRGPIPWPFICGVMGRS